MTKKYNFKEIIAYLESMSLQLSGTERMRLALQGIGPRQVAILAEPGATELGTNLLTVAEWLIRLEEYLNCQEGCSDVPTITPELFQPPKE